MLVFPAAASPAPAASPPPTTGYVAWWLGDAWKSTPLEGFERIIFIEQKIECDPLFGASSMKSKGVAITAHQAKLFIGSNSGERASFFRVQNDSSMNRQGMGTFMICSIARIELINHTMSDIDLFDSSPSAIGYQFGQILFGANSDR